MTKKERSLKKSKIKRIEYVGDQQTYDFCVPNTHCFFANNILVHNSGALEQAADKILFVYGVQDGDDVKHYINLAKNRQGETITHEVIFQGWRYRFVEPDEAMRQADYESTVNWSE